MKKIILCLIIIIVLSLSNPAFAITGNQDTGGGSGNTTQTQQDNTKTLPKITNPLKSDSVQDVIFLAVDIAIYIGTAFAILAIIFVGFKFVEARGNETKLKDAKQWFLWVIVGFAILISSKVIVEIVKNTLINSGVVNESVWNRN